MNSYQDRAYAAESQVRALTQRLHDAEAERDRLLDFRKGDGIEAAYRIFSDAVTERDAAQARIVALEEALEACLVPVHRTAHGHSAFANWQRCDWEPCLNARALLSPAPADAAHEPEAS